LQGRAVVHNFPILIIVIKVVLWKKALSTRAGFTLARGEALLGGVESNWRL
jgi:hypothetical protein